MLIPASDGSDSGGQNGEQGEFVSGETPGEVRIRRLVRRESRRRNFQVPGKTGSLSSFCLRSVGAFALRCTLSHDSPSARPAGHSLYCSARAPAVLSSGRVSVLRIVSRNLRNPLSLLLSLTSSVPFFALLVNCVWNTEHSTRRAGAPFFSRLFDASLLHVFMYSVCN